MSINFESFVERGGWWVIAQFALLAVIIGTFTQNTDPGTTLRTIGLSMVGAAVVLGGTGLWMIRAKLTAMPAPVAGAKLLDSGPYRLVRHPIYGAIVIGFVGLSIRGGNLAAVALSLLLIPFFYAKTTREESLLANRFPEYSAYQERVRRRFLPWVF